ncbi:MAG: 16S rRNA (guanine(966)-N(2))-methyltransferase RsmD [Sphaerochaetaceae bacterium]|nr:16S rRNA (guanine(966)-N(2))-methyltransferase RsmD [Sphaerochaetaceae bacterium]
MRVISGKYRSRKIKEVKSELTRPTTDRNKEALFNTIGQYFEDALFLDLFSGSGALGIEALSRGASHCDFLDNNYLACKVIQANLDSLKVEESYQIIKNDALKFLRTTDKKYDYILVDPPYALMKYQEILNTIASRQLLNSGGIIVFEADKNTVLPLKASNIYKYKDKTFGNTIFGFYHLEE